MNIEQRGASMAQELRKLSEKLKGQKLHIIAHSFSGVDCRAALSMFNASDCVASLTTVCSPHNGMSLIDNCNKYPEKYVLENVDKAFEAVGLSQKNAQEFTTSNLADFNKVAEDVPGVDYYSVGAQKQLYHTSGLLRQSHEMISESYIHLRNDGLLRPEEAEWGRYLLTFEQDHLEMIGFSHDFKPVNVYSLLVDNIKLSEIKSNQQEARNYGVDHLFQ
jgi:triacylglycerol lipase